MKFKLKTAPLLKTANSRLCSRYSKMERIALENMQKKKKNKPDACLLIFGITLIFKTHSKDGCSQQCCIDTSCSVQQSQESTCKLEVTEWCTKNKS